ncbi:MAG: glycoside hydrolase family 28 protein [Oscillospiraceae bacterium]|nr:glycoside hydrolase family 28 protein [Oscillospiraceae bacterium]
MIQVIYRSGSSACFELDGSSPYYARCGYAVLVDGEERFRRDTNVFSLHGLRPNTKYAVTVRFEDGGEEQVELNTPPETCCVNVRDFGAAGDGVHEDTAAIQAAISFLPEGGRLWFPAGTYLTLPLSLKSHITLDLDEDAVLLGSVQRERYPVIPSASVDPVTGKETPQTSFEGLEISAYQSLLQASYAEDIAIVGRGTIDGNGQNGDWWGDFKSFPAARPHVLLVNRCKNVTLHGVTVKNGPAWHIHPLFTQNFSMLDCFVTAPKDSPNTDGVNPESCDGVDIIGCRFSVGDDCIAVKAGKLDMALKYKTPSNHHAIRNCLMEFGHGAVTLGSELSAGIHNLSVTNCYFRATDRGLRIKTRRGRGKDSVIDHVLFDNIRMDKVLTPIVINMWYNCCDPDRYEEYVWSREHLPVDGRTPHLGSFAFRNMECTGAEVAACYIDGLPESPLDEVTLENIRVSFAEDAKPGMPSMKNQNQEQCRLGLYLDNVKTIRVKNVRLSGVNGKALVANHYEHIAAEDFEEDQ